MRDVVLAVQKCAFLGHAHILGQHAFVRGRVYLLSYQLGGFSTAKPALDATAFQTWKRSVTKLWQGWGLTNFQYLPRGLLRVDPCFCLRGTCIRRMVKGRDVRVGRLGCSIRNQ